MNAGSGADLYERGRGQSGRRCHDKPQLLRLLWVDVHHHLPPAFLRPLPKTNKQKQATLYLFTLY